MLPADPSPAHVDRAQRSALPPTLRGRSGVDHGCCPVASASAPCIVQDARRVRPRELGQSATRQLDRRHEIGGLDPKRDRQTLDRLDTDGSLPSLDQADMRPVKPGAIAQVFLREPVLLPGLPDPLPEQNGISATGHG